MPCFDVTQREWGPESGDGPFWFSSAVGVWSFNRPADQLKAIEMLIGRGFDRSPQQLDIARRVSNRPLEHLSDETLRLLVENARQLKEGRGVVVDGDGQVITE